MKIIPFSDEGLNEALTVLRNGGVVAHATETCYGLACDLGNPDAVAKLFAIKQRPEAQPVSALFASVDDAKEYVEWSERAEELAKQYLPGPLTLILSLKKNGLKQLWPTPGGQRTESRRQEASALPTDFCLLPTTLGIRVSSHAHAQSLIEAYGSPLSTTSANLHGQPNPYSAEDIVQQFGDQPVQPDFILDSGKLPPTPPSTIVDLTKNEQTHRKGSITI